MKVDINSQLERIAILGEEFLLSGSLAGEGESLVFGITDVAGPEVDFAQT